MFSLRWKIAGVLIISNLILGAVLIGIVNNTITKYIEQELIERGNTIAANLSNFATEQVLAEDIIGLRQTITNIMNYESVEYIIIENDKQAVLAKSFNGEVPLELQQILKEEKKEGFQQIDIESLNTSCYDIVSPIEDGFLGYTHVGIKKSYVDEIINKINLIVITIIAGVTLLGIIVVLLLANKIITPIIYLTKKANDISQGNLEEKVVVTTKDEIHDCPGQIKKTSDNTYIKSGVFMVQTRKLKDGSRQVILNGKQYDGITKVLTELANKTKASAILFADMSGQLISQRGNTDNMNTTVLSALAASDFAATSEMAKLVGEEAKFKLLFHEGEKRNVYLSNVGDNFFLVVVFDVSVTLGLIRIYTKKAIEDLNIILEDESGDAGEDEKIIDSDFSSLLGDALDDTFK